jgi:flavin-binding protein dodecin
MCPWRTGRVTKVKMVTARVIEIDGPLNQSEPEQFNIEVEVTLRITGNRGNVMKTGECS